MPEVSVIMSVFNGERFIIEAIDSILSQTFADYEFIIIDDGSTDTTAEILDTYTDQRIVRIKNEKNMGLVESLNRGLSIARGKYIARMDADDVSQPDRFAEQVRFLKENSDIDVLGTWAEIIDIDGNPSAKVEFSTEPHNIRWQMFFHCCVVHPSVMMRRSVYQKYGGYSAEFPHAEDYDLWLRIVEKARISNLPNVLLKLRKHEESVTNSLKKIHLENATKAVQKHISEVLGQHVSSEKVRAMRDPNQTRTAWETMDSAILLNRLYLVRTRHLVPEEKKEVRKDAAVRLQKMASSCFRINPALSIIILAYSILLSPGIQTRILILKNY